MSSNTTSDTTGTTLSADRQRVHARTFYLNNTELCKSRARDGSKRANTRNRAYVDTYLSNNPCIDCGESDIVVLEFDHVRGEKYKAISLLASNGCSLATLQSEIEKCEVRCANCHRRATVTRYNEKSQAASVPGSSPGLGSNFTTSLDAVGVRGCKASISVPVPAPSCPTRAIPIRLQ